MTDQPITYPGNYSINRLVIYPAPNSEPRQALELRSFAAKFTVVESMSNDCIRGTIGVVDSGGILESYPIRGEEVVFADIADSVGNIRTYRWFIYKIDNLKVSETSDGMTYVLHFVSFQRFISDQRKVTASYNQPITNTVNEIFNNYMKLPISSIRATDPNKEIRLEQSEGNVKVIIPRMTPVQAMKMLESRAYSSAHPTCSFRFFENAEEFLFVTDEFLYERAVTNNRIFDLTYAPVIPQDGSTIVDRMNNLSSLENISRVDTFDDMHGGNYRNKVIVLDIVNRTTNIVEPSFNYNTERSKYFSAYASELDVEDRHSPTFTESTFTDENARRFIMVRDYVDNDAGQLRGEQYLPEITSNRLAYFKQVNAIKLQASGPGRMDITCGDFVRLQIPSFRYATESSNINPQLSGIYMVDTVARRIAANEYVNDYILIKRNWAVPVNEIFNNAISSALIVDGTGGIA